MTGEIKEIIQDLNQELQNNPSKVKKVDGVIEVQFLDGENTGFHLVLKGDQPSVQNESAEEIDCTIKMAAKDFLKMVNGNLNTTMAFMSGKLKVKGNIGMALKLQEILSEYQKEK